MDTAKSAEIGRMQVAVEANVAAYRRMVNTSAPGDCWDFVVLTAANEKQAQGYRRELALRHRGVGPQPGFFPPLQRSIVAADPPGFRIGSGGATLGALRHLVTQYGLRENDFQRLRILLIHSGGISQRMPMYSPVGKIFAPLPLLRPDGQITTLFDHLYLTLAGLPPRLGPGLFVAAGDVFLLFDHRELAAPPKGVSAYTIKVEPELASEHGVYAINRAGRIQRTLQKVSVETMRRFGVLDARGRAPIDTGILFFDPKNALRLARSAGIPPLPPLAKGGRTMANGGRTTAGLVERFNMGMDLYEDFTGSLAAANDRKDFLAAKKTRALRGEIWRTWHDVPFHGLEVEGHFLHLGTTRQFRDAMIGRNSSPAAELFQQNLLAHVEWPMASGRRVYHSALLNSQPLTLPSPPRGEGKQRPLTLPPLPPLAKGGRTTAKGRRTTAALSSNLRSSRGAGKQRSGEIGAGSVIEYSVLSAPSKIGAGCVVSQVYATRKPFTLGNNLLLFQVPVRAAVGSRQSAGGRKQSAESSRQSAVTASCRLPAADLARLLFVHVLCGVDDDFKGKFAAGNCMYLNAPIEQWLKRHGIAANEIWAGIPAGERTLWTARIFPATPSREGVGEALWLSGENPVRAKTLAQWRRAPRYSMALVLRRADPGAMIEHREIVAAYLQTAALIDSIDRREDRPMDAIVGRYASTAACNASEQLLSQWAARRICAGHADAAIEALKQSRAYWCAAQLLQRPDRPGKNHNGNGGAFAGDALVAPDVYERAEDMMTNAFRKIAEACEIGYSGQAAQSSGLHRDPADRATLRPGLLIEARSPVRLDLSGGWSDTPPYCFEKGGHVVNVAIDLDGHPPVRVTVRTLSEPKLFLESKDLGRRVEVTVCSPRLKEGHAAGVHDPFALHKIALGMCGLLPFSPGRERVDSFYKRLGAGLAVTTECRVPKGSGLGTSSILAATLLAALQATGGKAPRNSNFKIAPAEIIEQTLILEQRLSTGGGWQDQIGGILGGVKSSIAAPGIPQRPEMEVLRLSDELYEQLQERLVVYYSGEQRLARNILRRVMGRWLAREPAVVLLTEELKQGAAALRSALLRGQWSRAARHIGRYWQIKKELYLGSTTPTIDVLFMETRAHYLAAGLAGAGGGGFAYFLCKDARQAARLRELLAGHSARPGSMGRVFETEINRDGLKLKIGTADERG